MTSLRQHRCANHPLREASARCPECHLTFCRECVTEHDDRVICAGCLALLTKSKEKKTSVWAWIPRLALFCCALAFIYGFVLLVGSELTAIPAQFHHLGEP